ncbi:hypothetical protein [Paenibacillus swuensis]|uniref:hypothetical protein n=1 Tax=Paenibacillus swuensis TaxID=1178515 RepID=UPI000A9C4AF8|nr:hypothetical protein [Paenibacillus swuensis]
MHSELQLSSAKGNASNGIQPWLDSKNALVARADSYMSEESSAIADLSYYQ